MVSTLLSIVGTLGYYGAYAVIIYLTVIGHRSAAGLFTIGVLTFLAGSFRQSRDLIQRVLLSLAQVFEQSLYLEDLFTFLDIEPSIREIRSEAVPCRTIPLRLRGVVFSTGRSTGPSDARFSLLRAARLAWLEKRRRKTPWSSCWRGSPPTEGRFCSTGRSQESTSTASGGCRVSSRTLRYDFF